MSNPTESLSSLVDDRIVIPSWIDDRHRPYQPYGSALDIMYSREDSVVASGPAGTGKSRAILEKMHLLMSKYPGARGLMVRKTRTSLTQSAMVTFEKFVIPQDGSVQWRTGEQEYRYANGSKIVVGGMDKAAKVLSSEYDFIYPQEATELSEEDWETLTTRCRYGRIPYNQVFGDCNPSSPWHWIKRKCDSGLMKMIKSVHEDNPTLYDQSTGLLTDRGEKYMSLLDKLTGVRYKRLRLGLWAAAEGMVYTEWDRDIHVIPRFYIPKDWARYWVVDFGFTAPFVWQAWAKDPEGRIYRFAEIYMTNLLVEDAAALIRIWMAENKESLPNALICDHDAEDRATLERHLGLETTPANKAVKPGIQSVMGRLRLQDDKLPRIFYLADSLLEQDVNLIDQMRPFCTEQEFDGYEWEDSIKKETPRKTDDHGLDTTRYLSMHLADASDSWVLGMRI